MNRADRRRAQRDGTTTDPMAITFYSNSIWVNTGYGTQSAQVVHRIADYGHPIAVASNYGLQATQMVYDGIPHYPMGVETWSSDVIEPTFQDWSRQHPDAKPQVIVLFDAWPLKMPAWDRLPVAIWTMIDHLPAPPGVLDFLRKPNVTPLAASRFAHEQIGKAGIDSIYIPMAIDTDIYRPTPTWNNGEKKLTGRQLMGFGDDAEDYFIVSSINANKSGNGVHRKAWAENALAMSVFMEAHDDVRWYIHTERNGIYGGVNFAPLISSLEIPKDRFRFVNQWAQHTGIPNEAMAALYTATDVLLAPTLGEGFGLTVLEAGACETPVIVSDFTCQPELVTDDCYLVGGQPWWDSHQAAWWQVPNVGEIVAALEAAYARGRVRSPKSREHIVANFDADLIFDTHWKPALERLAEQSATVLVPVEASPTTWTRNDDARPALSIYLPAYKRPSIGKLLASLSPQLTDRVEVIVSDDDPAGGAWPYVQVYLAESDARVDYSRRRVNIGGDANLLRGLTVGTAPWVWMIGDDDFVLDGSVAAVLAAIDDDDADRLILLSPQAPTTVAGARGTMTDLAGIDPALPIAATLISANVVRRSALDMRLGNEHIDTMYGWAWAHTTCQRVRVLDVPCIIVGHDAGDDYVTAAGFRGGPEGMALIWEDLLRGYGVTPVPESFGWNYVRAAKAGA